MEDIIELEWDSKFFNLRIGKSYIGDDGPSDGKTLLQRIKKENYDLVYVFSKHEITGLSRVDRKRIYICKKPVFENTDASISDFTGLPEQLYDLSYQAGHQSRFKADPNLPDDDFKRLYRLWIDNSINGSIADYVKVFIDEGIIKGFITAKKEADRITVGLIAVDGSCRGKGIGKKLISSVMNIAAGQNLCVEVATQADNVRACGFYERMGFSLADETSIYHIWNK